MFLRAQPWIPFLVALSGCASTSTPIPQTWTSVPEAARIRSVELDAEGKVNQGATPPARRTAAGPIRVENEFVAPKIMNGEKQLTDPFLAIDSLDFSEPRGEVVFSVRRRDDFEIGLVSSDGSPISWVPNDPADEVAVQWAPRGNKISYLIRARGGDIVRTLHVPTSFELSVAFPWGTIHDLAWDPQAERYAVAYSTPDASDRVEVMKYDGTSRKMSVSPEVQLDVEVESLINDAVVVRPRDLLYNEKLPVVIWPAERFDWNDARGALMKNARVAVVVTKRAVDDALWKAVDATPWIDGARTFVVGSPALPRGTQIVGDASVPAGRYRHSGNIVAVAPAVVQSFAAGYIADQLKRNPLTNGSSR